jgi:tungstate transport system ATP-binding protein
MLYRISDLTRAYGDRTVLDIPALEIDDSGICALIGANGAGKTTLLDLLAFLERPSNGTIEFQNEAVDFSVNGMQDFREQVVMVDQNPIMFTTTVYRNVEFGLKVRGVPANERGRRVAEALDWVGMGAFAGAMAHRLSGGETQRVALARALAVSPRVLLCDEPTASVDLEHQLAIIHILRRINAEKGIAILFTTHDRLQAASLADRILYLDHGRLTETGNENTFSGIVTGDGRSGRRCRIQDFFEIPLPDHLMGEPGDRIRLVLDPNRLSIESEASPDAYTGRIVQLSFEKDRIRIVVDIGIWIAILIDIEAYRTAPPTAGDTVSVRIPPGAVRPLL